MRDCDVRAALRERLAHQHAGDDNTRVVEEMGIWSGTVRVDVAVINGELSGFELKSDSDTLERLPYQIEIYNKVFDRVTLVVGSRHVDKAARIIPRWWGCIEATGNAANVRLRARRKGRINPNRDPNIIAQMLWKDEAVAVLEAHGLAKGWRSKKSTEICERLVSSLSFHDLRFHVREALKARVRLGQRQSSDLDVPVCVQADPRTRASTGGRSAGRNLVDLVIPPAMSECSTAAETDDLSRVAPQLVFHSTRARTFDLDPPENQESIAQAVLCVDGGQARNRFDRGVRRDASVVAKIEPKRQPMAAKHLPQGEFSPGELRCAVGLGTKSSGDTSPRNSDRTPAISAMQRRKRKRDGGAKRRNTRNATR